MRGGISTGPIAAQHSGNARIVSVLRFRPAPRSGCEGKAQRHPKGKTHSEIVRSQANRGSDDQTHRKSAIDHRVRSRIYPHDVGSMRR